MIQPSEPAFPPNWEDFITDEPPIANDDPDIGHFAQTAPTVEHQQATNGHHQTPEAQNSSTLSDTLPPSQTVIPPSKREAILAQFVASNKKILTPESDYIHFTRHTPHYWLDEYIRYSQERSPRGYSTLHELSGVFALSAAVGGRVRVSYVRWHSTALYFIGCAHSTHYAKSTTVNVARAVLDKAGLWWRFGPDMMTPQIMLSFLSDKSDKKEGDDRDESDDNSHAQDRQAARKYHEGQLAWVYDEFSQKLKSMMKDSGPFAEFHGILRKFNERPDSFEYATRTFGFERISYPYLTLMGLTTPDELRKFGGSGGQLWTDGFFARFLMVGPSPTDKPQLTPPRKIPPVPVEVIKPLAEMNQWLGFRDAYDKPLPMLMMEPSDEINDQFYQYELFLHDRCKENDLSASYKRIAVEHCPKMAALLAVSDGCKNVEMRHAKRAIEIGEKVRYGLDSLYRDLTIYTNTEKQKRQSQQEEKITKILSKAKKPMTVAQIRDKTGRSKNYRMSNQDVSSTLATLSDSGIATFEMRGKKQYWSLIPDSQ